MFFRFIVLLIFAATASCENEVIEDNRRLNKVFAVNGIGANDPICRAIGLTEAGLALTGYELKSAKIIEDNAQNALKGKIPEGVSMVPERVDHIPSTGVALLQSNDVSVTFNFEFKGIPFCQHNVLAYRNGENLIHYGNLPILPDFDKDTDLPSWPDMDSSLDLVLKRIWEQPAFADYQLSDLIYDKNQVKACLGYDEKGTLLPYWDFAEIRVAGHPNTIRAITNDREFFQDEYGEVFDQGFFTVNGIGNVFKRTLTGSSFSFDVTRVSFRDIGAGNFLCNSKFVPDKAIKKNNSFIYSENSENFGIFQVTIFHNANIHSNWIRDLPASEGWPGPQIRLTIDEDVNGQNNTAVYYPNGGGEGVPQIQLGDGDGRALKNLWKDPEVISHELGHHIVYRKLTETRGESLVLHEGLADYFVFARTNNPCLAETICPATSTVCDSAQCLRTADNDFTLTGADLPSEPHKISQLISGMLWDIGKQIGQLITADIVYHAINYLKDNSGYQEFLVALMVADKDLNLGENACLIKEIALLRGFDEKIANVDCNQFIVR